MSLFVGPIHHWLFNNIQSFEKIEKAIIQWAKNEGFSGNSQTEIYDQFGEPTEDKPLEEQIDSNNIHGWLQDKITKAELRQAI